MCAGALYPVILTGGRCSIGAGKGSSSKDTKGKGGKKPRGWLEKCAAMLCGVGIRYVPIPRDRGAGLTLPIGERGST